MKIALTAGSSSLQSGDHGLVQCFCHALCFSLHDPISHMFSHKFQFSFPQTLCWLFSHKSADQILISSLEKQGCFQPSVFRWEARNIRWASRANKAADQFVVCETIWMLISLRSLGLYMIHEKKFIIINNLNKLIFRTLICSTPYVAATGAQEKHSLQSIIPHIHSLKQRYSEHTQGGRLFSFVYVCLP